MSNDPFFSPDIYDRFEALRDDMATAEKRLARYEAMLEELADYFADRIDGEMIDGIPHMNRESTIHYEIQKVLACARPECFAVIEDEAEREEERRRMILQDGDAS